MLTEILPINENSLRLSKEIILRGGAVAIPTETVYGLGANALDGGAVKRVFEIKGRPNDNPLIVHVHKEYDISGLVSYIPQYAKRLAERFQPGPLTMVYKSKGAVPRGFVRARHRRGTRPVARGRASVFKVYRLADSRAVCEPFKACQSRDGGARFCRP